MQQENKRLKDELTRIKIAVDSFLNDGGAVGERGEKLKQEANYLQLKDWHKLSFFERQTVKKLENLGFLEKKAFANGFVGRSI